ncbi:MAG TPA: thioredoxin family protein [Fulvivirga sp.]|nr:thioredoxin family protein [Fulvivirga sp.]
MKTQKQTLIDKSRWDNAISYSEYRQLIDGLLDQKKTTGEDHSDKMIEYTQLNVQRMSKWDKISIINDELALAIENITKKQHWLIITEAWCGDAAQNIPIISKMADLNENIELRFILRDENLDIMDNYLTNGGRSIPKLIILDEDFNELGTWGPRPEPVQKLLAEFKSNPEASYEDFAVIVHTWYGKDRNATIQKEFLSLLSK